MPTTLETDGWDDVTEVCAVDGPFKFGQNSAGAIIDETALYEANGPVSGIRIWKHLDNRGSGIQQRYGTVWGAQHGKITAAAPHYEHLWDHTQDYVYDIELNMRYGKISAVKLYFDSGAAEW